MKRKYEYIIRVGAIAFCLLCVLVVLATVIYTAWDKDTLVENENPSQPTCEAEVVIIETEEQPEIIAKRPTRQNWWTATRPERMALSKIWT